MIMFYMEAFQNLNQEDAANKNAPANHVVGKLANNDWKVWIFQGK